MADITGMFHNTPSQILGEIVGGCFDGLQDKIEPREDSAFLRIDGGPEGGQWLLTLQRLPEQSESATRSTQAPVSA